VPYGGGSRTPAPLRERGQLLRASAVLASSKVKLKQQDFEPALKSAAHGDVCFLDPAYVALKRGPFDRYNAKLFKWADQVRLQKVATRAAARGAVVIVTNVDCKEIRSLYADALLIPLKRPKAIGNATKNSSAKHELLIVYDEPHWHNAWVQAAVTQSRSKLASRNHDTRHTAATRELRTTGNQKPTRNASRSRRYRDHGPLS
jgi:site-specific DNA-adenine methylase